MERGETFKIYWMSNGYVVGTRDGIVRAHFVKRLPDSEAWGLEFINEMMGTPWNFHAGRFGHMIPTVICEDVEGYGQDVRQTVIDVDEDVPEVTMPDTPPNKHRVFSALRDDIIKRGTTQQFRGCQAREVGEPFAHSEERRERAMNASMEEGSKEGRETAAPTKTRYIDR